MLLVVVIDNMNNEKSGWECKMNNKRKLLPLLLVLLLVVGVVIDCLPWKHALVCLHWNEWSRKGMNRMSRQGRLKEVQM